MRRIAWLLAALVLLAACTAQAQHRPTRQGPERTARAWTPPVGWRAESYGGVELAVPSSWVLGDLGAWCAYVGRSQRDSKPQVDRPYGVVPAIGCSPYVGSGVVFDRQARFAPQQSQVAPGIAVRHRDLGGVRVTVVLRGRALAARVLATAHLVDELDSHGCPARADVRRLGEADPSPVPLSALSGVTAASICRYGLFDPGDNARSSEQLGSADAADLANSLRHGTVLRAPRRSECDRSDDTLEGVLLRLRGTRGVTEVWVAYARCVGIGLDDGHRTYPLGARTTFWVLGRGWSGAVRTEIPLPHRLRY